jgi:hypothetical protein
LSSEIGLTPTGYYLLQEGTSPGYSQAAGGDFIFRLKESFDVGVGLNWSSLKYTWDAVKFIDENGGNSDTLADVFKVKVMANYLNIPLQFGFTSQFSDQWSLQVYPALDFSFLQKLTRDYEMEGANFTPNPENFGDITQRGRSFNMAINFGVGAEYMLAEKASLFSRIQFRYFFYPLIESDVLAEIPYSVGLQTGFRFYL